MPGSVPQSDLPDFYAAMDVFAFSSLSETQGLVLVEAMAAGIPVVALDAPGVREVVSDMQNGNLLPEEASTDEFSQSLAWVHESNPQQLASLREHARETADGYSHSITSGLTAALYRAAIEAYKSKKPRDASQLQATVDGLKEEWRILQNLANAVKDAVLAPDAEIG
jgi:glycosyltransferase involved in cell wall biosynthesis